ncbi:MAG: acetylxylan esterase [Clostridia bacterium]|nr:acetylxylan esterase [Spirochaetia bacterium]
MPLLDMPLDELKKYSGRNPRPHDFDVFWNKALKEMRDTDPNVLIEPATFTTPFADCFDLWFTGVRGARIHSRFLRPKKIEKPIPAVLQFHGYTGDCGDWSSKLAYVAAGFAVAAMDCRGQGGLSEDVGGIKGNTFSGHFIRGIDDDPDNMLMRHIFLDTAQLAAIVMAMPEIDENRIAAMGGSQGGALTIACASLEPRINRLAPFYPFLCDYQRVWEMDLAKDAYEELTTYFRQFDPLHIREKEIFTKLGYIDLQHLSRWIKGKTIMATGLMDTICPPSTQFAMYNKITSEKQLVLYPDFGHEGLPGFDDAIFTFMLGMLGSEA